jgi:hypothetical protein
MCMCIYDDYLREICMYVCKMSMYVMTDIHFPCAHHIDLYHLLCTDGLRFDMFHHFPLYCTEVYYISLVP